MLLRVTYRPLPLVVLLVIGALVLRESSPVASAADSVIAVDLTQPAKKASPLLYGIFVEDWSRQIEGGIYAEMVRNRNFDDTASAKEVLVAGFSMRLPEDEKTASAPAIPGWKLVAAGPAAAEMRIDQGRPLNARNPRSLRLEIREASSQTGIYNEGFSNKIPGVAVKQGREYRLSLFARAEAGSAGLGVSLITPEGRVLASDTISTLTDEWRKYDLTLLPNASFTGARLFISPTTAGVYHLDMVSLFPRDTWKHRPNGLRADLMEMVDAMRPAFVRFPGGCFVEGLEMENAWHWKNTLGPVEERSGHWNIWGWRYSGGLGYHEFLQMCADLGAEPVHVVNAGIAHTARDGRQIDGVYSYHPMERMHELVQDALDSIEYANGPIDSPWGARRAAAGRPEPFNLKFIEIGNENHGPEYAERYALFFDAIKARYPDVTVITNTWGANNYPRNRKPEVLDIHRFATPFAFALLYDQFDNQDRKGPQIYFGEWCAELDLPKKDSLKVGLYEGVFLTGLEKNSDIVTMMSYAPFMNNVGWNDRKPNMINFGLDRVSGAPIYWLQRIYAENKVDELLAFTARSPEFRPAKIGTIGVGAQATAAEFTDLRVTAPDGNVLFDGNTAPRGEWAAFGAKPPAHRPDTGAITFEAGPPARMLTKREFSGDYTIALRARKISGENGFRIYFDTYFNSLNYWQIGGDNNRSSKFMGEGFVKSDIPPFSVESDRWYELRLDVRGDEIRGYIDGHLVNSASYRPLQSLYVSAGRNPASSELVLKVVNITPEARRTVLRFDGAQIEPTGEAVVLTSDDPDARNTPDDPDRVLPRVTPLDGLASTFTHEFPAYSATVLKLRTVGRPVSANP